jgi:tetratricopeptide (TPR) repeat protein
LKRPAIAHSEYLQYAAETGLPATLLLIGLAAWLICVAARRAKSCPPQSRAIQEAAVLVALGLAVHGLVDNNWTVPVMAAGLVVFALADVLPWYEGTLDINWTPAKKLLSTVVLVVVYAHSTLIPSVGLWFNESGRQALIAQNFKKAESDYVKAVSILPFHSVVLDNTGAMYLDRYIQTHESEWLDLAENFFTRAIKANPDAEEPLRHMERALIQRLTGDVETDRPIHSKIAATDRALLRVDPFNPFVRRNLAEALYIVGERQQAEAELSRALEFEPNYVPGYLTIAEWKNEQGNSEQGRQYLQKAIAVVTKYKDFQTNEPYEALLLGRRDPALR